VTDAQRLYDFFMSQEGQEVVVKGYQYSLNPKVNSPKGARAFSELAKNTFEFSASFAQFMRVEEPKFKDKFAEIMFQ
jgi:ABC-type Fe3+ transport system substrate-binding protein